MTGAAAAQMPMPSISLGAKEKQKLTPDEQAAQDASDNAYGPTLQKIPEKKGVDPWGNIRATSPPQASQRHQKQAAVAPHSSFRRTRYRRDTADVRGHLIRHADVAKW